MSKLNLNHDKYAKRLQDAQAAWIARRFGAKYAAGANYGWVHNGSGKNFEITTKIYTKGILNSYYDDGEIEHEFEEFEKDDTDENSHQGIFSTKKSTPRFKSTWW